MPGYLYPIAFALIVLFISVVAHYLVVLPRSKK